jgi:hypothetical protein
LTTNVDVRNTGVKECPVHGGIPLVAPVMDGLREIGIYVGKF